ncbi:MAG: hypothetical protein QW587_04715 [Candidatus Bathyarchaeia archaeon]
MVSEDVRRGRIEEACLRLSEDDRGLLAKVWEVPPDSKEHVCSIIAKDLAKTKTQLKLTALIMHLLNEASDE